MKIVNHTGHKLISGYPEGRRMWLNIRWYDGNGALLREDGEYGEIGISVNGVAVKSLLDPSGANTKIYEAHMGLTREWAAQLVGLGYPAGLPLSYDRLSGEPVCRLGNLAQVNGLPPCDGDPEYHESFHFVLNNAVIADNRIPPFGMSYDLARIRNALPVPADQYGGAPGGVYDYFDEVSLDPPGGAESAEIRLLYQPTSWEYIQFLSLANTGGNAFLADEGTNLLDAWLNTGMAEPHVMAATTWGTPTGGCSAQNPNLLSATPADKQVNLAWSPVGGDPGLMGYRLYYDQAGKAQAVAELPCTVGDQAGCTSYLDTGLTNGQQYCYKVASYNAACESGFSNILCAVPTQPGQAVPAGVAEPLRIGKWVADGKGKNSTTTFVETADFLLGDEIVIRATVLDETGAPVPNATVTFALGGPEPTELLSGPSGADGVAQASWKTQAPNKRGQGGTTPGSYPVTVTGVTASGFSWDGVTTSATFTLGP